VNVRVLCIVVGNRHPFEGRTEIILHALDQAARQAGQIDSITKFRRYDQFQNRSSPAACQLSSCAAMSIALLSD